MEWAVYVSIPLVAALIGYLTERVAIEMVFRPVRFAGLRGTPLGWQGVLPRNAGRMAHTATDLLIENLISPEDLFARLDPDQVAAHLEGPLSRVVEDVTREVLTEQRPGLWELVPGRARRAVLEQTRTETPAAVRRVMDQIAADLDRVLDIDHLVASNPVRDGAALNRVIRRAAKPELDVNARCAALFGFTVGLVQLVVWALSGQAWVLPVFGLAIGWATDWLAIRMIFSPRAPRRFLGVLTWQGVFQKRRPEIAAGYGDLIAREVVTVPNIVTELLTGPRCDRVFAMIEREVLALMDAQAGIAKPLLVLAMGTARFQELKQSVTDRVLARIPDTVRHVQDYAAEAMDLRATLVARMRQLTPTEFESLLRPAFRREEWKLIIVGALIGCAIGGLPALALLR